MSQSRPPLNALASVWGLGGLSLEALHRVVLTGLDPVLPSSFAVGTAAQVSMAAAALAACELGVTRGQTPQTVTVDMAQAAMECQGWYSLNGVTPDPWDALSGLYSCADGWLRLHTNFAHHRTGVLDLLGLPHSTQQRELVQQALKSWRAVGFETQAAQRGMVVAAARSFADWDAHPQGQAIAAQPLFTLERVADGPVLALPPVGEQQRPLSGVRVLDLTRIVAGPIAGRTLAAYGADVMLVNAPHLPNIDMIAEASRGKLSTHLDLRDAGQRQQMDTLLAGSHVFMQGYRPGGLAALGYSPKELARKRPGLVMVSLSAYSEQGPWAQRRGFDSLVQTATGFNLAEAQAATASKPQALPMQILDYATGFLMAFATSAALVRQQQEGGTWHVKVSLAQTGHWLRSLGRVATEWGADAPALPDRAAFLEHYASGFGELVAMRHSAKFSRTPAGWHRPAVPPGTHTPKWPSL